MKNTVKYSLQTIVFSTFFIGFSLIYAAQPQLEAKPSLTQNAIQSIENSLNVLKQNPETLAKADILIEKTMQEIKDVEKTLERDLSKDEQKKLGKAIEKEGKQLGKNLEIFIKHHAEHLDHKIEKILGADKKNHCEKTIKTAEKNVEDTAKALAFDNNSKKLGKDLETAYQPIKEALDAHCEAIDESMNTNH